MAFPFSQEREAAGLAAAEALAFGFSHRLDESEDMHSLLLADNNTLLVGGLQNHVLEIDLNTVQETQKVWTWVVRRKDPLWELKSRWGYAWAVVC